MNDQLSNIQFPNKLRIIPFLILFLAQTISITNAQENTIGVTDITWDVTDGFTIFSSGFKNFYNQ